MHLCGRMGWKGWRASPAARHFLRLHRAERCRNPARLRRCPLPAETAGSPQVELPRTGPRTAQSWLHRQEAPSGTGGTSRRSHRSRLLRARSIRQASSDWRASAAQCGCGPCPSLHPPPYPHFIILIRSEATSVAGYRHEVRSVADAQLFQPTALVHVEADGASAGRPGLASESRSRIIPAVRLRLRDRRSKSGQRRLLKRMRVTRK